MPGYCIARTHAHAIWTVGATEPRAGDRHVVEATLGVEAAHRERHRHVGRDRAALVVVVVPDSVSYACVTGGGVAGRAAGMTVKVCDCKRALHVR